MLPYFFLMNRLPPASTLFPYTTLFRSDVCSRRCTKSHDMFRSSLSACCRAKPPAAASLPVAIRSEEHTSELQSRRDLVCRLLLEKKNWCDGRRLQVTRSPCSRRASGLW